MSHDESNMNFMQVEHPHNEGATLDASADLETVLAAWHDATLRLERTHEALRSEVARLNCELEVKNRELARQNRLADLGQMASHVAHEVRNNLVPVTLYLSLLRRRLNNDHDCRDILAKVEAGMLALDTTVNDLLHFTSDRDPSCETTSLAPLVEELHSSLAPQFSAQAIQFSVDVEASLTIPADRNMLRRALLNLILNSLDAMPRGGEMIITAFDAGHGVEIEVADSGEGFSDDSLRKAFEPFYTSKSGGTGLGLAIVERVAQMHQGHVEAMNCPEGGAAVTIYLPRLQQPKAAA